MAEGKKQRVVRSKEERIAAIDEKIATHEKNIATLKEAKQAIIEGRRTTSKKKGLKRILTEAKLSDDETAKALGFKDAEEMKAKLLAAAEKKDK